MTNKKPAPVVRSIDTGFGLVKFTLPAGSDVSYTHFPSIAVPTEQQTATFRGVRPRDTYNVPVAGSHYEVGHEVAGALTGHEFGREITDEFYKTPLYEALTKGALRYMAEAGDTAIDMLVLGLPVSQYLDESRCEYLRKTYTGTLDLGGGKTMEVRDVFVHAQPMGGFLVLSAHLDKVNEAIRTSHPNVGEIKDATQHNILMIDPGEYTLDWLLIMKGSLTRKASGAVSDAGRNRIVTAVFESLQSKLGRPLGSAAMVRINESLRTGVPLRLSGVDHDLAEFDPLIRSVIADPISRLISGLRSMHDYIDLIVFVGGHPEMYRDIIAERFPNIPTYIIEPSVEANVRGFQAMGEVIVQGEPARSRA